MCKSVSLKIFCSHAPCQVQIYDGSGTLLKTCTVMCRSTICLCTASCTLKVVAQYQGQTLCQIICLRCWPYQTAWASFCFRVPTPVLITLRDRNYGLPVPSANLNFQPSLA